MEKYIQKLANIIARQSGYHSATSIKIDRRLKKGTGKITKRIDYGYRKFSDDSYVSNAYRNNFGWKNTYYQCAVTEVTLNY